MWKVECCLCYANVSQKQSKRNYPICARCNSNTSEIGFLFREVLYMCKNNSPHFKKKFKKLFWKEFNKLNWFCGTPGLSAKALYYCIFYKYTVYTSSDATFIASEENEMKKCMSAWQKTVEQEKLTRLKTESSAEPDEIRM
jgi:hypothetical protein